MIYELLRKLGKFGDDKFLFKVCAEEFKMFSSFSFLYIFVFLPSSSCSWHIAVIAKLIF